MSEQSYNDIFSPEVLRKIFPLDRSDNFFDALYGDASEGAYDISLQFKAAGKKELHFEFLLKERPGKCLVCSVTYGLPQVFNRHPIINVKGVVEEIDRLLEGKAKCTEWRLGRTNELSKKLHVVPLVITLG
ncbi:conserved hypothetical protein [uncultured Desulfobacterium sp.]|uniref:Pancreas/duodenum homeobox protein 1 n=1 Tax=uncultured Desulfobacterium sp. TaxID=201089 RepID=A0A445N143_9BACT|nr:conserved hypothetical protein [uncultured Desulfobacterium sp.]